MAEDWQLAGRAWSERARDVAYLFEPFARPAYHEVFDQLRVGSGAKLLDVACGGGYAAMMAAERGASITGIDASEGLIEVARTRVPRHPRPGLGDLRIDTSGRTVAEVADLIAGRW